MAKNGICCYIDILGFSNFVAEDPKGAIYLLQNYQTQLLQFKEIPKEDDYLTPYRQDSFKYLIPFSDSIFIYSEDPSAFVMQLSDFINGSFSFTSNAFSNPTDKQHPENVIERGVELENGKLVTKEYSEKWYPLLFRGGIGFGDAKVFELNGIQNGKPAKTPFMFGNSVIEAVRYEGLKIKGPRILCSKEFYNQLTPRAKKIVHPVSEYPELYEVNWTAVHYLMTDELNDFFVDKLLLNDFYVDIFVPAVNLWKAYRNNADIEEHYFSFLKLIVRGVQHFFKDTAYQEKANIDLKKFLLQENLELEMNSLLSL